ncbi:hypothetical protein GCM10027070_20670 [Barrientosiimonas humi]
MDPEREPLFAAHGVHHHRAAILRQIKDPLPQLFPHPSRHGTDEDAWGDLHQPPGQMTAESSGAGGEHENYHGTSSA